MEVFSDGFHRRDDEAHVRVFGLAQRRRDTDVDGVQVADYGEIGRRTEALLAYQLRDLGGRNILNVRFAAVQPLNLRLLDIDSGDVETDFRKLHRQRQANITQPDDSDPRGPGFDFFL